MVKCRTVQLPGGQAAYHVDLFQYALVERGAGYARRRTQKADARNSASKVAMIATFCFIGGSPAGR